MRSLRTRTIHPIRRLNDCDMHGAVGLELAMERRGRGTLSYDQRFITFCQRDMRMLNCGRIPTTFAKAMPNRGRDNSVNGA